MITESQTKINILEQERPSGAVAQLVEQRFALWEDVSLTLAGPTLKGTEEKVLPL